MCAVCVFAHVRLPEEMHKRKIALWLLSESHVPRDDEFCMGLSPVCTLPVYCMPYIYTLLYLQADT